MLTVFLPPSISNSFIWFIPNFLAKPNFTLPSSASSFKKLPMSNVSLIF